MTDIKSLTYANGDFQNEENSSFCKFRGSSSTTDQTIRWHKRSPAMNIEENHHKRICLLHRENKTITKQQLKNALLY